MAVASDPCTSPDFLRWCYPSHGGSISKNRWAFELKQDRRNQQLWFYIIIDSITTKEEAQACLIHQDHALILAYLDLNYWSKFSQMPNWNRNRLVSYLGQMREDVVRELMGMDRRMLPNVGYRPSTLREWAVRVRRGHGHSQTGRNEYYEYCKKKGVRPYDEDYLSYGEIHDGTRREDNHTN